MATTRTLKDVPAGKVDDIVQQFKDAGATTVTKKKQPNGKYTVTGIFP